MAIVIGRHVEGVTLNGYEYVLNENGTVKEFKDKKEAIDFLLDAGADEDDIPYYKFIVSDTHEEFEE